MYIMQAEFLLKVAGAQPGKMDTNLCSSCFANILFLGGCTFLLHTYVHQNSTSEVKPLMSWGNEVAALISKYFLSYLGCQEQDLVVIMVCVCPVRWCPLSEGTGAPWGVELEHEHTHHWQVRRICYYLCLIINIYFVLVDTFCDISLAKTVGACSQESFFGSSVWSPLDLQDCVGGAPA